MRRFLEDFYPVEWAGGQAVVALPEHIGISNAGQVREELLSLINRGATTLIADMTATVSCDQAGAEAVIRARIWAAASGTELRLVVTAPIVARVLRLVGPDRTVSVYPLLEAAAAGPRAEGVPGRDAGNIAALRDRRPGTRGHRAAAPATPPIVGVVNRIGAYTPPQALSSLDIGVLRQQLEVNLVTAVIITKYAMPMLAARGGGPIVHVSSRFAGQDGAGGFAQSVSKLGVLRLVEAAAAEGRGDGVRVSCIMPSVIGTPAERAALPDAAYGQWPKPSELAAVLAFLVSDDAVLISGAAVPVYGRAQFGRAAPRLDQATLSLALYPPRRARRPPMMISSTAGEAYGRPYAQRRAGLPGCHRGAGPQRGHALRQPLASGAGSYFGTLDCWRGAALSPASRTPARPAGRLARPAPASRPAKPCRLPASAWPGSHFPERHVPVRPAQPGGSRPLPRRRTRRERPCSART
jgi:NAD(P)-dependent dehydrogenase (short-subunit alcohol dehydrogenase family)